MDIGWPLGCRRFKDVLRRSPYESELFLVIGNLVFRLLLPLAREPGELSELVAVIASPDNHHWSRFNILAGWHVLIFRRVSFARETLDFPFDLDGATDYDDILLIDLALLEDLLSGLIVCVGSNFEKLPSDMDGVLYEKFESLASSEVPKPHRQ